MSEKVDIWMPLYVARYLADTAHLSAEESGAYLHLMMHSWMRPLPKDMEQLRRITRVEKRAWPAVWAAIKEFWQETETSFVQKFQEKVRAEALDNKAKAVEKAKNAAERRWGTKRSATSNASSMPEALHKQCPIPTPLSVSSNEETKTRASDDGFPQRPYASIAQEIVCSHPKAIARSLTALDVTHAQMAAVLEAVQSECRNSGCSPEMAEEMILRMTRDIAAAVQEWPPGEQPRIVRDIVPFFRERDYRRPIEQWRYQGAGNRNRNQNRSDRNIDALRRAGGLE